MDYMHEDICRDNKYAREITDGKRAYHEFMNREFDKLKKNEHFCMRVENIPFKIFKQVFFLGAAIIIGIMVIDTIISKL